MLINTKQLTFKCCYNILNNTNVSINLNNTNINGTMDNTTIDSASYCNTYSIEARQTTDISGIVIIITSGLLILLFLCCCFPKQLNACIDFLCGNKNRRNQNVQNVLNIESNTRASTEQNSHGNIIAIDAELNAIGVNMAQSRLNVSMSNSDRNNVVELSNNVLQEAALEISHNLPPADISFVIARIPNLNINQNQLNKIQEKSQQRLSQVDNKYIDSNMGDEPVSFR